MFTEQKIVAAFHKLSETERGLFDAETERIRHPSLIVETLEAVSGRSTQRLERRHKVEAA